MNTPAEPPKFRYPYLADAIGDTPIVRLTRMEPAGSVVLAKLEGANPAGSVKDRAAFAMITAAQESGAIGQGSQIVESTSGNTGIALAAAAAALGLHMVITIPEGTSQERLDIMRAYGAEVILTPKDGGMELARDRAQAIAAERGALLLNQFANPANPNAHYEVTAREVWDQTRGTITHLVCAMGTTGTVTGTSKAFAEFAPHVKVVGVQPAPGESVPGIRAWPPEYVPAIFDGTDIAEVREVTAQRAIQTAQELARTEGLLLGPSSGGAAAIAIDIARQTPGSVVVFIAPDRGDRYLSTGIFGRLG